jgi:hypothetical protein
MRFDYTDDPALSDHLEESIFDYFNENYTNTNSTETSAPLSMPSTPVQPAPTAPGLPQNPLWLDITGKTEHQSMN